MYSLVTAILILTPYTPCVFFRWSSPTYRLFNVDETHSGDYRCQVVITGAAGGDMVSEMSNSLKVIVGGE